MKFFLEWLVAGRTRSKELVRMNLSACNSMKLCFLVGDEDMHVHVPALKHKLT